MELKENLSLLLKEERLLEVFMAIKDEEGELFTKIRNYYLSLENFHGPHAAPDGPKERAEMAVRRFRVELKDYCRVRAKAGIFGSLINVLWSLGQLITLYHLINFDGLADSIRPHFGESYTFINGPFVMVSLVTLMFGLKRQFGFPDDD